MTTVFQTTDVYEWWKVKKALRKNHLIVKDTRVCGDKMFLEVPNVDEAKATMIIKRIIKTD